MKAVRRFSWQGVRMKVPLHWEMTAESGSRTEAYFRLDEENTPRLEARWERVQKEKRPSPPMVLDNYLKTLTKGKKQLRSMKVMSKGSSRVGGHEASYMLWGDGEKMITTSWYCQHRDKVFLVQYFMKGGDIQQGMREAEALLSSIECHPEGEYMEWTLLGVEFMVPSEYSLRWRKMRVGSVSLLFSSKSRDLLVGWEALAEVKLSEAGSLLTWFNRRAAKDIEKALASKIPKPTAGQFKGCQSLEFKAESEGLIKRLISPGYFRGRVWHEREIDRIFGVFIKDRSPKRTATPSSDEVFEAVTGSLKPLQQGPARPEAEA